MKLAARESWPCKCGKLLYTAPEILIATGDSPAFDPLKLDVWALGIMLFILLIGRPPWPVQTGPTLRNACFQYVCLGKLEKLLKAWKVDLSPPAVDLLRNLLELEPDDRPTLAEVRQFPWFSGGNNL